jgi:hypothetical protein
LRGCIANERAALNPKAGDVVIQAPVRSDDSTLVAAALEELEQVGVYFVAAFAWQR